MSPILEAELDNFDVRFISLLTARKTIQSGLSISAVLKLMYFEHENVVVHDPKDQIHAPLGLARDRSGITLNSTWSVGAVYVEATQCLLRGGFTDILLCFKPYDWSSIATIYRRGCITGRRKAWIASSSMQARLARGSRWPSPARLNTSPGLRWWAYESVVLGGPRTVSELCSGRAVQ